MSDKKKYYEAFTSPAGEAVFPWLSKADFTYNVGGVFKTDLVMPPEIADSFIAKLEKVRDDFILTLTAAQQQALIPRPVFAMDMTRPGFTKDMTTEEKDAIRATFLPQETGNVSFRFKMKGTVTPKSGEAFTQAPIIVSAETGEKITGPVYGGSILRVRGQIVPYTNAAQGIVGITLRLKAVQVLELVTGGTGGGSTFWTDGFNDEAA